MGTSKETISAWFQDGVKRGATHMLVVCDTFDHGDFPIYVMPGEDVRKKAKEHNDRDKMLRLMEVYKLGMDEDEQLNQGRAFNY